MRLVEILYQFFRQRDLVGSPTHYQCILREQLLHALHIQHGANRIHHILQFGGQGKIREIKSLEDALFQFLALGGSVLRDENRIQRDRAPEGFRLQRRNLQRLFEGHSIQVDIDDSGSVIGVEQHVDPGQLSDSVVDHVGLLGEHLDGDGDIGDGSEFHRTGRVVDLALQADGRPGSLRRRIPLVVNDLQNLFQFLLGDE